MTMSAPAIAITGMVMNSRMTATVMSKTRLTPSCTDRRGLFTMADPSGRMRDARAGNRHLARRSRRRARPGGADGITEHALELARQQVTVEALPRQAVRGDARLGEPPLVAECL